MIIKQTFRTLKSTALIALMLLLTDCSRNPVTGKRQLLLMSEAQELALGKESDPQVLNQYGMYPDEALQKYLSEKGKEIAKVSHRPDLDFQYKVIDSDVVNAFAIPGGYVYFTRGIMAHFNSEAQLMGVLGHETGHVTARHSAQQYTSQTFSQIGLVIGMIAFPKFQQFGNAASTGLQLMFLKNSRDHETQADKLGVDYSSRLGYDAKDMADFFKTLGRLGAGDDGKQQIPSFLSTHPDPGDRFNNVKAMATAYQTQNPQTYRTEREKYLRLLDGVVYGEDPRQGYVESNQFYHPELKFQFPVPQNWKYVNTPSQVQMVSADQKGMMILAVGGEKSLDEAAAAVLKQYSLAVVNQKNTQINGLPAIMQLADQVPQQAQEQAQAQAMNMQKTNKNPSGSNGQSQPSSTSSRPTSTANPSNPTPPSSSPQGQPTTTQDPTTPRVLTALIQYNGAIYRIHGVSTLADFNTYVNTFQATMQGFKPLTDAAKINVSPDRLRLRQVLFDGTLNDAFKAFGMPEKRYKELSILNGIALTDRVTSGMTLKTFSK